MANIFDYLEWRSDVPFSCDPFNEVDNLSDTVRSNKGFGSTGK